MSDSQDIHQRCVRRRASARANMELAIAEYEASISKMVCDTLQIASERAQGVIETARKKRKLNEDIKQDEGAKRNEEAKEDEDDEDSDDEDEEEEREKGIFGLRS